MSSPVVFVCGATGTQGGALIQQLLVHKIQIRAISRNINSVAALNLKLQNVSLREGDFDDEDILRESMSGCTTLFLNLSPNRNNANGESEQAELILSVAKAVGVRHVIYTSALVTSSPQQLEHWDPRSPVCMAVLKKQIIENKVRNGGFETWSILRPGNFMSNFLDPLARMYQGLVETGNFMTAFTRDTILPMVDPNDIGKFAAAAVFDPVGFDRTEIELISEMMSLDSVLQELSQVTGKKLQAVYLSDQEVKQQAPKNILLEAQLVMRDMSKFVDLEKLKGWNISLGTFAQFLDREKGRVQKTYAE
ncbi:hypothetical protein N7462_010494 [Penicillium macrosclerotiorum]|uniref:uncharacterized protein n=1 Tax=Penicillium macrosclerotiorum TaxID=303699 RepID=UPI00254917D7|nr:uncharacterized protein N7462_010494 [Penicillium macrosclerotiorum]KAJ5669424.1 hypothetical protein N7462_010494 [Penicillium macrosclerotiorum]